MLDSKSASAAAADCPTFTFIDQSDDLTTRRIKDANTRKAIRSHAMRGVRRRERLAGLKRPLRCNNRAQKPAVIHTYNADADANSSKAQKLVLTTTSSFSAPSRPQVTDLEVSLKGNQRGRRPATFMAGSPTPSFNTDPWLYLIPWLPDPFNTLPGAGEVPSMIARLVFYCKLPFFP